MPKHSSESSRLVVVGALLLGLVASLLPATNAIAQDRGNHESYGRIVPYLWLSNIDGRNTVGGELVHVGDDKLKPAFAFQAEYGKGRWRGIFEFSKGSVANVAEKGVDPTSTGGHCCGPDQVAVVDGPYDFSITSAELMASVQVGAFVPHRGIEVQAGFRYTHQSQDLALTDPVLVGTYTASWVEPIVGLRFYTNIGSKVWFTMRTNVGGFGMGSTFTWVLDGELGYRITDQLDALFRVKYLEADYSNGADGVDEYRWHKGQSQGWHFGVAYKW